MNEHTKYFFDAASVGTVVATITGWLPSVAAIFTIVWTGIRIYESPTAQQLLKRLKEKVDK